MMGWIWKVLEITCLERKGMEGVRGSLLAMMRGMVVGV